MADDAKTKSSKSQGVAALRLVHGGALGYQPYRMKPVHFATGFVIALTGLSYKLEILNKVSIPKASPQTHSAKPDPYLLDEVRTALVESETLHADVDPASLGLLRSHLQAMLDNDGGSFAMFSPYKSQSNDYSLPATEYASGQSKNHGGAGSFVLKVLERTVEGREFIERARRILKDLPPPQADLGRPLLDEDGVEDEVDYEATFGVDQAQIDRAADLMSDQTAALALLASNIERLRFLYAVRYLLLGLCSWLYLYMMRRNDNEPVLLIDACRGLNTRTRGQSCAAYARQLNVWSASYDVWSEQAPEREEAWSRFRGKDKVRRDIDDHFRDFGVRIGFVQPRAAQARQKHFELSPDTLRVIAMSVLGEGEVLQFPDFARLLRDRWFLYTGAARADGELLFGHGFTPLDEDDDLKRNADEFASLMINLGLAVEPSDGLVLCALDVAELI